MVYYVGYYVVLGFKDSAGVDYRKIPERHIDLNDFLRRAKAGWRFHGELTRVDVYVYEGNRPYSMDYDTVMILVEWLRQHNVNKRDSNEAHNQN